jgi:uncharacterized protein
MRVISNNPEQSRYELVEDGAVVGLAEYRELTGRIAFTHTETDPARAGQGLAAELVTFALDDVRSRGLAVLPLCPYVRAFVAKHPDQYLDLVPEADHARFGLPG